MKLYTCKGGLPEHETLKQNVRSEYKRKQQQKTANMQPPLISAAKVASSYLITTIIKKGMNKYNIGLNFCRRWTFENVRRDLTR